MQFLTQLVASLPRLSWSAIIDIAAVSFLIYQFILIIRGRRAAHIISGLGIVLLAYLAAVSLNLELLRTLLANIAPYSAFALIVMFQSEIRRVLARLGRRRGFTFGSRLQRREAAAEIVLAATQLAHRKTGALIVLERDIGLRTFVESGIVLDAVLSHDLLMAIFEPGASMHDGAVVVQGSRIAAAACFLPLTMRTSFTRKLGTRHRAAIGVTEEADALAVIVSEETGRISTAAYGEIEFDLTPDQLHKRIALHLDRKDSPPAGHAEPRILPEEA